MTSPRLLELEKNFKKNGGVFKQYKVKDFFDIHPTCAYKKTNKTLFSVAGKNRVITNTSNNNGIGGYSELGTTEQGNIITFSDTTDANAIFYQDSPFIGYPHVQGLYPKEEEKITWTSRSLLYFVSLFKFEALKKGFNYGQKFQRKLASEFSIELPVVRGGAIDIKYMEDYIRELEEDYIRELDSFLEVAGLNDYELSDDELQILRNPPNYSSLKVNKLFLVKQSKKKFNANSIKFGGSFPYVARGSSANGIRGYIDQNPEYLNEARTISFGQDTATAYYQDKAFFTGDKIKVFKAKEQELNEETGLFLVATLQKSFSLYSWGSSSFSQDALENEKISIPLNDNKEPDWNYMEAFIKAVKKLVIADVVKFKNEYIEKSKQAIK